MLSSTNKSDAFIPYKKNSFYNMNRGKYFVLA